jgi:phosphatidylserine/phosphatidylglycerophosphate/cardiolipin synthase-like enzyme
MHAKFVIVDRGGRKSAWFGSLNYNLNSRFLNREILASSTDPVLISDLGRRFSVIAGEAETFSATARTPAGSCGHRWPPAARMIVASNIQHTSATRRCGR